MPVFAEDIARLVPQLRRFARALVCRHSVQFADDLVQETVVLAMRAERIAGGGHLTAWCYATLMRVHRARSQAVRDIGQTEGRRPDHDASIPFLPRPIVRLDLLSIDCREALLLTVLVGMTYSQAAEVLHVTTDVVLHRLDLARACLSKADRPEVSGLWPSTADGRPARQAHHHLRLVK